MYQLDPATTALVLIDLQKGILQLPLQPYSRDEVVDRSLRFSSYCRKHDVPVFLVRVTWHQDMKDVLTAKVDAPMHRTELPPEWDVFTEGLQQPQDIVITKRQWGAFHGTDLDLQLRRRGIKTVILGGVVTNFGVESTARNVWEHGYDLVIAEDLCSSVDTVMHEFAVQKIFPRLAHVEQSTGVTFE